MAHVTDLGFTMEELRQAIVAGDVRTQHHPEFPELVIHNYTEEVQFKKKWNKITLACRGLILNIDTHEIVARPWEKFFNFGERDLTIDFNAPVEVTDKMDGSLGILYQEPSVNNRPGNWCIATRGSFASEQAEHATELLATKYRDFLVDAMGSYYLGFTTYLFEIIYPDNRIVCNYGTMDDLVLLGGVDRARGYYYGPDAAGAQIAWPGPRTEVFKYDTFGEAISAKDRKGAEGIVIRSGSKMVKLKQADYVELHRIVTNLSPRTVWAQMGEGKTVDDICSQIPDEFHGYVKNIGDDLTAQANEITFTTAIEFSQIRGKLWNGEGTEISRRAWADEIKKSTYPALLFNMLDNKSIRDSVWKMIRPAGDAKLVSDDS